MAFCLNVCARLLRVHHANELVNDSQWTYIKHAYRVHRSVYIFSFIVAYIRRLHVTLIENSIINAEVGIV